jgi:predicted  nucleic acid-binding Zn-ribbon protein
MQVTAQIVNEIMAQKTHTCAHCGRILYHADNFVETPIG